MEPPSSVGLGRKEQIRVSLERRKLGKEVGGGKQTGGGGTPEPERHSVRNKAK